MKQLGDGVFEVPSDSDYGRTYIVNLTGEHAQCTCVHFAIQRNKQAAKGLPPKDCKHIRGVRSNPSLTAEYEARQQALREAEAERLAEKAAKQNAQMEKMKAELQQLLES